MQSPGIGVKSRPQPLEQSSPQPTSPTGKEKRRCFRTKSSGYGTGSSQGSSDKTDGALEEEVFEDLYTASNVTSVEHMSGRQKETNSYRAQFNLLEPHNGSSSSNEGSNSTFLESCNSVENDTVMIPHLSVLLNNNQPGSGHSQSVSQHSRSSLPQHDATSFMSREEVSFELQSWQPNCGEIATEDRPKSTESTAEDQQTSESWLPNNTESAADDQQTSGSNAESLTSVRDLLSQWPLSDYLSNQQESPNFSLNGLESEAVFGQRQSDGTQYSEALMCHGTPTKHEESVSSMVDSESNFSSISIPSDQQVPQALVDKMFTSAQAKLKTDEFQKLLSTLALDEDDTISLVFQEIEKMRFDRFDSDLSSGKNTSSKRQSAGQKRHTSDLEMLDSQLGALHLQNAMTKEDSFQSSECPCDYPQIHRLISPPLPSSVQGEDEVERELLFQRLQIAALCLDKTCQNVECSLGQELLRHLEERLEQNLTYESISCQQMLKTIAWHAEVCEELKCPVPYCQFFQETDIPFPEQIARLQQTLYSCFTEIAEPSCATDLFMKVCASFPKENRPLKEGVDWSFISKMGRFGQGPYYVQSSVFDTPTSSDVPFYWVVKKMKNNFHGVNLLEINTEKNNSCEMEVLRALTGNARVHLIHLLWFLFQQSCVLMCSRFEGRSLQDHVSSLEGGMSKDLTFTYLRQLIDATAYLHKRNILYLNWTCDHVVVVAGVDSSPGRVKLCNLTTAIVCRDEIEDEDLLEQIVMTLPPHVIAPELSSLTCVGDYSDIWGLGCIAFEMYCGFKIHNEIRHLDLMSQRSKISQNPVPNIANVKEVTMLNVLNSAFQIETKRRALSRLDALCFNG